MVACNFHNGFDESEVVGFHSSRSDQIVVSVGKTRIGLDGRQVQATGCFEIPLDLVCNPELTQDLRIIRLQAQGFLERPFRFRLLANFQQRQPECTPGFRVIGRQSEKTTINADSLGMLAE